MMFKLINPSDPACRRYGSFSVVAQRTVALLAVLGAGVAVMGAQTSAPATAQAGTVAQQSSAAMQPSATQPSLNVAIPASGALFSSSASEDTDTPVTEASVVPTTPDFAKMMQYSAGQQRGYNGPRYRSSYENADNSMKWIFYGGAGFSQTVGNTWHYLTPNFGLQIGGGRQFSKRFAVPIEYDFDYFDMTRRTLDDQSTIYFGEEHVGLGANSHIWSFSVDPTYTVYSGDSWGAYVVGGVGYFHKVANFTLPSGFGGCYGYYYSCGNFNIDHYTSNAPGYDGGFGLTYKFSPTSVARFYAEARYVFVDNSQRSGVTINNYTTAPASSSDFYPANSNRTTYIPIKAGIRF